MLSETNKVLYQDECEQLSQVTVTTKNSFGVLADMEQQSSLTKHEPTNSDIVTILGNIERRISDMDKRMATLESLEKKVDSFDIELKKIWLYIDSKTKSMDDKIGKIQDQVDSVEMVAGFGQDRMQQLEQENKVLKESITYLQSQSMRNNLIFGNIEESPNEKPKDTEVKVRDFLTEKLKLTKDTVDSMKIERAHRMGPPVIAPPETEGSDEVRTKPRRIVCKFNLFSDREMIRRSSSNLKETDYYITEQFPPDVVNKRKKLVKPMKEAREQGKKAWISYDTLYIEGKPVKDK